MPHDAALVAETRAWFARAAEDLRAAGVAADADPPLVTHALFNAQQAAEKAVKGFLTWHRQPFRKTHSIEEIGEQALRIDPSLDSVIDAAVPLSEFAWRYRYPGEPEDPSLAEAREAISIATTLHEALLERIPAALEL